MLDLAFSPILNVVDGIVSRTTGGPTPPATSPRRTS